MSWKSGYRGITWKLIYPILVKLNSAFPCFDSFEGVYLEL